MASFYYQQVSESKIHIEDGGSMVLSSGCKSIFKLFWWFKIFLWLTSCQIWKPLLCNTPPFFNLALPFLTTPERLCWHLVLLLPSSRNPEGVIPGTSLSFTPSAIHWPYSGALTSERSARPPSSSHLLPRPVPSSRDVPSAPAHTCLPFKPQHKGHFLWGALLWPLPHILCEAPWTSFHGAY